MHHRPIAQNMLVAAGLSWTLSAVAACADPAPAVDLTPLREQKSVLVQTKDDRWIEGKPIGVLGDTLVLRKGRTAARVGSGDIAGVWTSRPAPLRTALVRGAAGVVGAALLEIALGARCVDCSTDAGDVLSSAALGGVVGAVGGAIDGLFGGRWQRLVPPNGDGLGPQPFPGWGASVSGGVAQRLSTSSPHVVGRLSVSSWTYDASVASTGVEYGTLPVRGGYRNSPGLLYVPLNPGEVLTRSGRERWAYTTTQLRVRPRGGRVRPEIQFGAGVYFQRKVSTAVLRDSTGVVLGQSTHYQTDSLFGANAGLGLSLGRGAARPGIDVRMHFTPFDGQRWYTIGLKADWH